MTINTATAIATRLMSCSDVFVSWSYEYPDWIALNTDSGALWCIGTANGTFGADLYLLSSQHAAGRSPYLTVETPVPSTEQNAVTIADALFVAMTTGEATRRSERRQADRDEHNWRNTRKG